MDKEDRDESKACNKAFKERRRPRTVMRKVNGEWKTEKEIGK